ncbi:MAG TPA: phosphopantetheine-binding protein [Kofleriaceae bacterium]|jgi:acyl carrier protein|nr:phosphopantetheine-binding protein [Kofleriaceae bacterium]
MTQDSRPIADKIAGYWKELLGVDAVQPDDDFIGLGGDSVRATMLANRIEDELGVRPEIAELFTTLDQVARHCEALLAGPELAAGGGA